MPADAGLFIVLGGVLISRGFVALSESPGDKATTEQLSMLYTRYHRARELARGREVLEVACGAGFGLGYMSAVATRVVATDIDPEFVATVRSRGLSVARIHQADAAALPFGEAEFDVVLLLEAIYYLPDPVRFLAEAFRVLRPGGTLLVVSANPLRKQFNPGARTTRYFSLDELRQLLSDGGFTTHCYGAFPDSSTGIRGLIARVARGIAVTLRLIPATMRAKAALKRLFFGPLTSLPADVKDGMAHLEPLVEIPASADSRAFRVIYVEGVKPATASRTDSGVD
jgi:SAM-dependent methyltransferase